LFETAGHPPEQATRFADALLEFYDNDSNGLNHREFNAVCKGGKFNKNKTIFIQLT